MLNVFCCKPFKKPCCNFELNIYNEIYTYNACAGYSLYKL